MGAALPPTSPVPHHMHRCRALPIPYVPVNPHPPTSISSVASTSTVQRYQLLAAVQPRQYIGLPKERGQVGGLHDLRYRAVQAGGTRRAAHGSTAHSGQLWAAMEAQVVQPRRRGLEGAAGQAKAATEGGGGVSRLPNPCRQYPQETPHLSPPPHLDRHRKVPGRCRRHLAAAPGATVSRAIPAACRRSSSRRRRSRRSRRSGRRAQQPYAVHPSEGAAPQQYEPIVCGTLQYQTGRVQQPGRWLALQLRQPGGQLGAGRRTTAGTANTITTTAAAAGVQCSGSGSPKGDGTAGVA